MLYEFAITPQCFGREEIGQDGKPRWELIEILEGIADSGLIADLHNSHWFKDVKERINELPPEAKDRIHELLELLDKRHRLVLRAARQPNQPRSNVEWLQEMWATHQAKALHAMVISETECAIPNYNHAPATSLLQTRESAVWTDRKDAMRVWMCAPDYDRILAPVLRYARRCLLIDPYVAPNSPKFLQTVKICSRLLGVGLPPAKHPVLEIHCKQSEQLLGLWKDKLESHLPPGQSVEVFHWSEKPGGQDFHDRYILTDQCGLEVGKGLDCYRTKQYRTLWKRIPDEVRSELWFEYQPREGSPYELVGKVGIQPRRR